MPDRSTADQARRRQTPVEDHELINAVYRHTPAGTQEIADAVDISRQGVGYRLKKLEARGEVWSKKVGPTRVWMHPGVASSR